VCRDGRKKQRKRYLPVSARVINDGRRFLMNNHWTSNKYVCIFGRLFQGEEATSSCVKKNLNVLEI